MDIGQAEYATLFIDEDGRQLWRTGQVIGDEIIIPKGMRPFPNEDRTYTKEKEIRVDKQDSDDAIYAAMDEE